MLLNAIEKAAMNNPLRATIQRRYEARRLLALGGRLHGGAALELGCGRGVGVELILELFGAETVDAFDLDPDMVSRAKARLASRGERVRLTVGDATQLAAPADKYAAVFDFGIVHHIPKWRNALAEVLRVLEPGGRFYAEEIYRRFLESHASRLLFDHPNEDRFDHVTFVDALTKTGFEVVADEQFHGLWGFVVARRPSQP